MRNILLIFGMLWCMSLEAVRFSEEAKCNSQLLDSANQTVTLIFATDSSHFAVPVDSILGVYVSGSINDLQDMAEGYELDQLSEDSCFYKTFTVEELIKPGNSGQPEFVFYVMMKDSSEGNYYAYNMHKAKIDPRLLMYNGIAYTMIIMPSGIYYFTTDLDELGERCETAREIRPLSDYQLTDSADQHRISNFRLTPGTVNLYRSYHPYLPTNKQYDTEAERLHWVDELAIQAGIKSAICLTGNKEALAGTKYTCGGDTFVITIPQYMQDIIDRGDICYVGTQIGKHPSEVLCFYHSEDSLFALWMKEVVEFIADDHHPMPMQIHCALGADRTGMVCATIAALCGADWQDILLDYSETSNMKIQTYRHPNRLRYAMQRMTGLDADHCSSAELAAAIRTHLVDHMQVVSNAQIDQMVKRLTHPTTTLMEHANCPYGSGKRYDLMGREASSTYRGPVIENGVLIMRP